MQIKSKQALVSLKGEPLKNGEEEFTLGEALAGILVQTKEGGPMRMYKLAKAFYAGENVEADENDIILIKRAVEAARNEYNNLITGQILTLLEDHATA